MPEAGPDGGRNEAAAERPEILRAKYHDYCSAQLADLLLYLSPDEIYLLAQKVARERDLPDQMSYAEIVAGATEWLSRKVVLPPFEIWLEDYRKHPRDYEEYFMGFWEAELETSPDG